VCPHCGANPRELSAIIHAGISKYLRIAGGILLSVLPLALTARKLWSWDSLMPLLVVLGVSWVVNVARERRHQPITALEIGSRKKSETTVSLPPPRPPEVPREWKPLISLPRPREVYIPLGKALWLSAEAVFIVVMIGRFVSSVHRHPMPLGQWITHRWGEVPFVVVALIALPILLRHIAQEFENWSLLRDGEVTIGVIADWISMGEGKVAVYRFWTQSGQRFEHEKRVYSDESAFKDIGLVPVFYLAQEPTKSVALCCTVLRVRTATEPTPSRASQPGKIF